MTTKTTPDIKKRPGEKPEVTLPWKVILYNDDVHSFDEVILQVQKAVGCSLLEAERITFEAHFKGKAVAYQGSFQACFRVAEILREINLIIEIQG